MEQVILYNKTSRRKLFHLGNSAFSFHKQSEEFFSTKMLNLQEKKKQKRTDFGPILLIFLLTTPENNSSKQKIVFFSFVVCLLVGKHEMRTKIKPDRYIGDEFFEC